MYGGVAAWLHAFLSSVLDASCKVNATAALLPGKDTWLLIGGPQKHCTVCAPDGNRTQIPRSSIPYLNRCRV
jgi:hypothetical protein